MGDKVQQSAGVADGASGRDLPAAIAVGVLLSGAFLGSLFWSPLAFSLVVAVIGAVAVVEAGTVLEQLDPPPPVVRPVLVLGVVATVSGAYVLGPSGQALGMLVLVLGGFASLMAVADRRDVVTTLGTTLVLGGWVGLLASYGVLLALRDDGVTAVLAVVGAAILGDIGGYAVGRTLGRTPIAPTVSPNKTVEGLLGGVALAAVLAWLVLPRVEEELFARPAVAVAVAVLSVLAGFLGDLAESMVKRDLGVKDLGDMLPGHGGMLDRVDGLLFALPVGYYAIELLG